HFLEHLLFKGTVEQPPRAFERIVESKGGQFNAATSQDYTHYYITIARPHLKTALKLHADMLMNAVIPADELDRERLVVLEEINRAEDNPQHLLFKALNEKLYGDHGYGQTVLG